MKTRQSTRVPLNATGSYRTSRGMQWDVELEDLSAGGCMIHDRQGRLKLGEYVRLYIAGTGPHLAEVAWQIGGNAGLAFTRPLPDRVFTALAAADWNAAAKAYRDESRGGSARRFV